MIDDPPVADLVRAAVAGDSGAWNSLVKRYLPLVFSVIRTYRLADRDAEDVSQTLWLRLVEHLTDIREPRALPSWIITTTRNEALRTLSQRGKTIQVDPMAGDHFDRESDSPAIDEQIIRAESRQALRDALAELEPRDRDLLQLLAADPPLPYAEISQRMGIPIGSIGPTRGRCLHRLRATAALKNYLADDNGQVSSGGGRDERVDLGR